MKQLTIFTPTYNRSHTLPRVYESLLHQESQLFKWLIVDDGSTDGTRNLVESWIEAAKLEIIYVYEENSGKMAAFNRAVEECDTELLLCCDSDDWMEPNSIKPALQYWNEFKLKSPSLTGRAREVSGMVSPRRIPNRDIPFLSSLPSGKHFDTLSGFYEKGLKVDTAIFFRTSVIKKYPFPIIKGEKFISEGYILRQMDDKYYLLLYPHYCMVCEYQEDGYSNNVMKLRLANPKSFLLSESDILRRHFKIYKAVQVLALLEYIGEPYKLKDYPRPLVLFLLKPLGKLLAAKYRIIKKRIGLK